PLPRAGPGGGAQPHPEEQDRDALPQLPGRQAVPDLPQGPGRRHHRAQLPRRSDRREAMEGEGLRLGIHAEPQGKEELMLFEEIRIRDVRIRNRIVVSPMCQYSAQDGHVTDWHLVHLGKFAQGGAAAVFVEATAVERRGRITHGDTGIWDDGHIPGLKRITEFVKSQGAVPALQLAHAGRKASMARPWYGNAPLTQADFDRGDKPWSIIAPTEQPLDAGWIAPRAFREGDFQAVLGAYRNAVRRAVAAGFELLELHAAHAYLRHTFLSPLSNTRQDDYGGPLESRMRFPLEVAAEVRKAWPASKPLFVRCSSIDDVEGGWRRDDTG